VNYPTRTFTTALAVLLLLAGTAATQKLNTPIFSLAQITHDSFAVGVAQAKQPHGPEENRNPTPDDTQDRPCRSDEIREYLLQHGIVPPSIEIEERLLAAPTPEVRVIYLVPSDRQPRSEAPIALTNGIKHLQRWYWEQVGNGKTFKLHDPIVEIMRSSHDTRWFSTNPAGDNPSLYLWFNSINDASAKFFDPNYTYVIYIDVEAPGQAVGGNGGVALLPQHDILGMIGQNTLEPKVCRWVGGLGHELGHALGLPHPPECDSHQSPDNSFPCQSLMYLGYAIYPDTYLLADNKDKLNQSPFIVLLQLNAEPFNCSNLLGDLARPSINSVDFNGTKKLTVSGQKFGIAPRLLINSEDRTDFITGISDTTIRVKGKSKKLGLKAGDNTVQVFDTGGTASNVFLLRL
jgi:hypothetical protein